MIIRAQIYLRSTRSKVTKSQHIRVRHLRVREYVKLDEVEVKWVGTKEMLANGFTMTLLGPASSDLKDKILLRTR